MDALPGFSGVSSLHHSYAHQSVLLSIAALQPWPHSNRASFTPRPGVCWAADTQQQRAVYLEERLHTSTQVQSLLLAVVASHIALHATTVEQPWHEGSQLAGLQIRDGLLIAADMPSLGLRQHGLVVDGRLVRLLVLHIAVVFL